MPGGGDFRFGSFPYSIMLHLFDSVLLHAACVDFGGRCALMPAPDEGGKTTAAGLFGEYRVLSDDFVLLRRSGRGFTAWGTPWTTFPPVQAGSDIGGIFLLEKAGSFELVQAGMTECFSALWADHGFMQRMMPAGHAESFFGLCSDIAASAPVRRMRFPAGYLDAGAVKAVCQR
jgi:hypothetical protein